MWQIVAKPAGNVTITQETKQEYKQQSKSKLWPITMKDSQELKTLTKAEISDDEYVALQRL